MMEDHDEDDDGIDEEFDYVSQRSSASFLL